MSFELTYELPKWYIILCILAGLLFAFILYYGHTKKKENPHSKLLIYFLATLRFFSTAILFFLLLNPLLKYMGSRTEKPIIVLGIDNSSSLLIAGDSNYYKNEFAQAIDQFEEKIRTKYELVKYSVGAKSELNENLAFDEPQTDLSSFFKLQKEVFEGQNVGAVVLSSDGIYNKGINPLYALNNNKHPIHTILLGDTTKHKDVKISNIRHNQITYLHNSFPVVIDIQALKNNGKNVQVSIWKNGVKLADQNVAINSQNFSKSLSFQLEAKSTGSQRYQVRVSKTADDYYPANNSRSFYVDVMDSRQKILICGIAAHPDLGALKRTIETNKNYELKTKLGTLPNETEVKEYSLVILHQYPLFASQNNAIKKLVDKQVPILYILGASSNVNAYSKLGNPLNIRGVTGNPNRSIANLNPDFILFELAEEHKNKFAKFPPLSSPFGKYEFNNVNNSLFKQKIGVVDTDQPLVYFNNDQGYRTGYIAGEGFWRWRLMDFEMHGNFDATNDFISKTIQYLSIKKDMRKLRISSASKSYNENENIYLDGELYNDNYEPINRPDLNLSISNSEGKNYDFVFSKYSNRYKLQVGKLPSGDYSYIASCNVNGKKHEYKGFFVVKELELENINLEANHNLLKQISNSSNGGSFYPNQLAQLAEQLLNDENILPVSYSQNTFKELIHQKWIFFLLIMLLSVEWFVRKWNGL